MRVLRAAAGAPLLIASLLVISPDPAAAAGCAALSPGQDIQAALNDASNVCVLLQPGTYVVTSAVAVPDNKILTGVAGLRDQTVIRANKSAATPSGAARQWSGTEGLVKNAGPSFSTPATVSHLTIDGNSSNNKAYENNTSVYDGAMIGVSAPSMILDDVHITRFRCDGVSSYQDLMLGGAITTVIQNSLVDNGGEECAGTNVAAPGGGIYVHDVPLGNVTAARVEITATTVRNVDGSGVDIANVDNGAITDSTITNNSVYAGYAAVSIADASGWTLTGNTIAAPRRSGALTGKQSACTADGPAGEGTSGVFLCAHNRPITGTTLQGNSITGYYGIVVNSDAAVASGNQLTANNVFGSNYGCADRVRNSPANTWQNNNCRGGTYPVANETPGMF